MNDEQKWRAKIQIAVWEKVCPHLGPTENRQQTELLALLIEYGEEVRRETCEEVFAVVNTVPDYEVVAAVRALATKKEPGT